MSSFDKLIKEIASTLKKSGWQLVTAESCTGGLIAGYLTEIPGSSDWFERGFVTYSNLAKEEQLSVPKSLIEKYGAVSEPVAQAMATGALQHSAGDVAVAVTGIAGPDGGSIEKPVGTVCFGWAALGVTPKTLIKQYTGNRQEVRLAACQEALSGILSYLKSSSVP
ncbi:CinA family protein [Legionella longbeachae]|uniref:Competence-damage inducible protein CinA n=1 Tax=Legionella longbeachae serogroup 1 (strain NSW150) TaxID=661367 RepID=D3HRE4_LEGLN|nr:CinA family protein [Legionella longbeachae]VEE01977.1 Competence-damage inducible protein CinA [Legionella oakridgensis]HBD7396771.1 CinA family protein [Legionella pneumophila]ARB91714.1 CinA family protein [Legionella longbeachae]ARM35142.1 CinA family protein [Legionella longbeachae]EEZ95416.1 competence/damage-inducible protein CinA domain protein [Legionella longbeachae D-4968]